MFRTILGSDEGSGKFSPMQNLFWESFAYHASNACSLNLCPFTTRFVFLIFFVRRNIDFCAIPKDDFCSLNLFFVPAQTFWSSTQIDFKVL